MPSCPTRRRNSGRRSTGWAAIRSGRPTSSSWRDGRFYFYYCVGRLDAPRAALGIAVSDSITGPYTNLGVILKSGMFGEPSHDGTIYDPTRHPNTVDPDVFFDRTGRLWMVYGSYSGGIFILELDPATGFPLPNQGYGKKLIGGNHSADRGGLHPLQPRVATTTTCSSRSADSMPTAATTSAWAAPAVRTVRSSMRRATISRTWRARRARCSTMSRLRRSA